MLGTYEERMQSIDELYPQWENYTLWEYFEMNYRRFSDRKFLIYDGEYHSYGDIYKYALKISESLWAIGVRAGSHVAVCLPNLPEYVALIFAIARLGAVKVSVNVNVGADELRYIVEKAEVDVFFCSDKKLLPELSHMKRLRKIICITEDNREANGVCTWQDFLAMGDGWTVPDGRPGPESHTLCDIMFTSGSTSNPKGVMMTHDMLVCSGYATARTRGMEPGRCICVPIPLFHAFAYVEGLLSAVTVGGCLILFKEKFRAAATLAMMRKEGANGVSI